MSTKLARGRYYGTLQDILASMSHHIQLILVGDFYQLPPVGGEAATRSINQGPDPDAIDAGGVAYTTFLPSTRRSCTGRIRTCRLGSRKRRASSHSRPRAGGTRSWCPVCCRASFAHRITFCLRVCVRCARASRRAQRSRRWWRPQLALCFHATASYPRHLCLSSDKYRRTADSQLCAIEGEDQRARRRILQASRGGHA